MTDSRHTSPPRPSDDDIAAFLRDRTEWNGQTPQLWQAALNEPAPAAEVPNRPSILARINSSPARVALLTAAILLTLSIGVWVSIQQVREPVLRQGRALGGAAELQDQGDYTKTTAARAYLKASDFEKRATDDWRVEGKSDQAFAGPGPAASLDRPASPAELDSRRNRLTPSPSQPSNTPDLNRLVIRKATIELIVPPAEVRAAFAKAQHLLRLDSGEFAEASNLTGDGDTIRAQLTLRVLAAGGRLDAVLNELRALGKVHAENATGDDVTSQAVDLDARLRNERRIETELLELVEARKDAPLKDVLELRDNLSRIRAEIEQLQARRDTLGRQVALATILVIIRPDPKPVEEPQKEGASAFLTHTGESFSAALKGGARTLVHSLAFIVELLIAGAFWWILLTIIIIAIRRHLAGSPKVSIGRDPVRA